MSHSRPKESSTTRILAKIPTKPLIVHTLAEEAKPLSKESQLLILQHQLSQVLPQLETMHFGENSVTMPLPGEAALFIERLSIIAVFTNSFPTLLINMPVKKYSQLEVDAETFNLMVGENAFEKAKQAQAAAKKKNTSEETSRSTYRP